MELKLQLELRTNPVNKKECLSGSSFFLNNSGEDRRTKA